MVEVARRGLLVMSSRLVGAALGYLVLVAVGRYYDDASFGAVLFAMGLIGLGDSLTTLGLPQAMTRTVARGESGPREQATYLRLRLLGITILSSLTLGGLWLWHQAGGRFSDATTDTVVLLCLALYCAQQLRSVPVAIWNGEGRMHRVQVTDLVDAGAVALFVSLSGLAIAHATGRWVPLPGLAAWWGDLLGLHGGLSAHGLAVVLAGSYLAGDLLALGVSLAWWLRDGIHVRGWDPVVARRLLTFSIPLGAAALLAIVVNSLDRVMIGYFGSAAELGDYGAGQRLSAIILLSAAAVQTVLLTHFSALHEDPKQAARALANAERFLLLVGLPPAIFFMVLPRDVLHVAVGDAFLDAAPALVLLAPLAVLLSLSMVLRTYLVAAGDTRSVMRATALNLGANAALNLVLIPDALFGVRLAGLGAVGAAIASLVSTSVAYLDNRRRAKTGASIALPATKALAAGAGAAAFWWLARRHLGATAFDRSWELAVWALAGMAVFLLAAGVARLWTREDLRDLRAIFQPGHLLGTFTGRGPKQP